MSTKSESLSDRQWMIINAISLVVMAPAVVSHELTHALAAKPWAKDVSVEIWPQPQALIQYPAGTPELAIRFVNSAPTLVGAILAIPFIAWYASDPNVYLLAYIGANWIVYTVPASEEDRKPLTAGKVE